MSKRRKDENKGKKEKKCLGIVQLNNKDVFWVTLFIGNGSKMDEAEDKCTGNVRVGYRKQEVLTPPISPT